MEEIYQSYVQQIDEAFFKSHSWPVGDRPKQRQSVNDTLDHIINNINDAIFGGQLSDADGEELKNKVEDYACGLTG